MMEGLTRNVVLFEREEVRLAENGDVFTGTLSEISQIKQKPGRFKTEINFRRDMTSDEVRIVLEEKFPLLQNRRYGKMKDDLCLRDLLFSVLLIFPWQKCIKTFC